MVRLLLEAAPAAAMAASEDGWLPLHVAAQEGHEAVVRLLLEAAPAAAMTTSASGYLPLHWAAYAGHEAVARLLLEAAPAAAMTASEGGWLSLHVAAYIGDEAVVCLLLRAAPQAAAATGVNGTPGTPLQLACHQGHTSTARALLGLALRRQRWPPWLLPAQLASPSSPISCWLLATCPWLPPTGRWCPRSAPASSARCPQRWPAGRSRPCRWCSACSLQRRRAYASLRCAWAAMACRVQWQR